MKIKTKLPGLFTAFMLFLTPLADFAQAPNMGSATSFALFTNAGAIANTGTSEVWGNVGTLAGAYSGSPTVNGQVYIADAVAAQVALAVDSIYTYLVGLPCDSSVGAVLGNNQVLPPRVYCEGGAASLNGTLTLDGQGNPNALFIFKINGALSTTPYSNIVFINSASVSNLYWQVNGAFTLATYSSFSGTVVTDAAIALATFASLDGRGLSTAGAISLYNNTVNLGIQPTLAITAGGNTTLCSGGSVTLTATVSNGIAPFTYLWSPGGGTDSAITVSPLTKTTYTVNVTSLNGGLNNSDTLTVFISPAIIINTAGTNVSCYGGSNGSGSAIVSGGKVPYTYTWMNNSLAVVSTTNPTGNILGSGSYTLTVTDKNGCFDTASVNITQASSLSIGAGPINNVSCPNGSNGRATVTVSGGTTPFTYSWINAGNTVVCTSQSTPSILSGGTYTITVQDSCGASATATVNISQPTPSNDSISSLTDIKCNGGNGGSATISAKGGTFPYSYLWSVGQSSATVSGLSAGTYSVTITDKNGCVNTLTGITITQPGALRDSVAIITYPACNTGKGLVTIGVKYGTQPYTYTWSPNVSTSATASSVPAQSYTVNIKDNHGCTSVVTFTITQPLAIRDSIVTAKTVNVSCSGNNGSATVGVKYGAIPYTYAWSPNVGSAATVSGLSAGTYSVTITDKNGCLSSTVALNISSASLLRDSISLHYNVGCNGGNGGELSVGTEGGTLPYTYLWQPNGKTTYNISSLTAGTYTVTVTDKAGCSITLSATITQPASALGSVIPTPTCIGSGNGIVTISESGGTGPYTYIWSNGSTKTSMTVSSGTYRVTLHDANGCSATNSVTFLCPNTPGKMGDEGHELNRDYYPANNDVSLYPNPNTGQFTLSGLEKGMIIEMYSYTGRIINSITATDITMQINISAQPNGIYLLRILSEDGTPVSQKKVVKTQ